MLNKKYNKKLPKLIINADDFGISNGVNDAILELSNQKIVTSVSVMTNMPYYHDVRKLHPATGIGIHLNLTVGKPVSTELQKSALTKPNGGFYPLNDLLKKVYSGTISKKIIQTEFEAQIQSLRDIDILPDHLNTHQSLLKYPIFFKIIYKIARKFSIPAIRTYGIKRKFTQWLRPTSFIKIMYLNYQISFLKCHNIISSDKCDSLLSKNLTYEMGIARCLKVLSDLDNKTTELIVHPGFIDNGNEDLGNYVHQREIEYLILKDKSIQSKIKEMNIKLISFKNMQ